MPLFEITVLTLAVALSIPTLLFVLECGLALMPQRRSTIPPKQPVPPSVAVLVPAHNEAAGILPTLEALLPQIGVRDRLVVIADNCSDETAEVARQAGVTVIERQDAQRRGKGYALDFGLQFLAAEPPDVVVIVDADCLVMVDTIAKISQLAMDRVRPVQATYLLATPARPQPKDSVSALAFTVKNWVRLAGLSRLGLHAILTGTGMAFPWQVLQRVSLASGNIVEDMQISVDLAIAGVSPVFCGDTRVTGSLPQQGQAATSQRTRWEHGHLQTLTTQVPRLLKAAVKQRRWDLLIFGLDLSIPPLSLLVMMWGVIGVGAIAAAILGASGLAMIIVGLNLSLVLGAVFASWAKFARQEISGSALLAIPFYVLWKIPLYFKFLVKPQTQWVRTERDALEHRP